MSDDELIYSARDMESVEENARQQIELYDRQIGVLCYKGNSVSWWQSKAENYKQALLDAWDAAGALGITADGETDLATAIRRHAKST